MEAASLEARLRREVAGEVRFDAFTRGRYGTDASIYQIRPLGVVIPRRVDDIAATIAICGTAGIAVLPRGAGTSQCGQTVGEAVVVDTSVHLDRVLDIDVERRIARVEPGIVLDDLNRDLQRHGLFFPVDPSTASRATIGGMAGNNSSGARSIRYGNMVHNVQAIDAILADGTQAAFGPVPPSLDGVAPARYRDLIERVRSIARRESSEIAARMPKVLRRVGGYNIDLIDQRAGNMAELLVGSEGTLGFFTAIDLRLAEIPRHKALGICHFPRFYDAMTSTKDLVALGPVAVELVDRTMIELARANAAFAPTMRTFVTGEPDALLLVEFTGADDGELREKLDALERTMGALGFPAAVVRVVDAAAQTDVWSVRAAGLNIMTSIKGDPKPVSIIEDCAVPLEHLADYTQRLTRIFERHGTVGTWYAHASVGCLHVRPVLNMKSDADVRTLRAIAEEAFAIVREYGGSHSGEHGDGIVRSEFHAQMFGERIVRAFEEVKDAFDPAGIMNPGKIVRAPKMDDRRLFRYAEGYAPIDLTTALDWSEWGGFTGAVEMCNNNGACRKAEPGVMCPSYLVTKDETHVTRGRANVLRLAMTGQLGADAFTSDAMYESLDLCVSCKACRRECPTGVDMAKMKIEFLHHYHKRHGWRVKDRVVANLPRLAPLARRLRRIVGLRDRVPLVAALTERIGGISARRTLPRWSADPFDERREPARSRTGAVGGEVALFVDTFNRWFHPENARAALRVLEAANATVHLVGAPARERPLCCGRTFLSAGLVDDARAEARRVVTAFAPYVERGVPVVGLEPSCLLTLRDEFLSIMPSEATRALAAGALLFEEFVARERAAGRFAVPLQPLEHDTAYLHGHCHQKAFGAMPAVEATLRLVPGLAVRSIASSCCGMAGTFGYEREHYDVSMRMAERSLLPALRAAPAGALIVTDGVSCRQQIRDGAGRDALHVARVLEMALAQPAP